MEAAIAARSPEKAGRETKFLCPIHDDHQPSARWNSSKRQWFCDPCGLGGGLYDLAEQLGIDLPPPDGLTVAQLAEAKGLSVKFLNDLGVRDGVTGVHRTPCVDVPYEDENGNVQAVRKRINLTGPNRFLWRKGDHPMPYGLSVLPNARDRANLLIFVEGESDTWVCRKAGIPALGIPGASMMKREWGRYAEGVANVFVWQEPGQGGITFVEKVAAAVPTVKVIIAPPDAKDPGELWLACGRDADEFHARMSELAHSGIYASAIKSDTSRAEAREAFALASDLLRAPDLIDRVGEAIRASGYAGDTKPPMIAYVALTSRLLARPLNLAFVGPSAAGKNRAVDAGLALMPASAYIVEKAGSARALVYGEESYEHRVVVVSEADSIPEDGPAASAIRALAADNEMTYDVVERDSSGKFVVRHIVKPGPTGLITTSTRPLPHQFDTRALTVSVTDTPGQTRDVMRAHAASVNGEHVAPDLSNFIALQRWLELAGTREVSVPFASHLAELVPADHVRMRRDFRQLLTVIESLALLHQQQRDRDASGRIIATVDDYGQARSLLLETFQGAATAGLTDSVRQTVQMVHRLFEEKPLTVQAIATGLKLSKETTWYRVRRAISQGYLVNDETRKAHPAKIRPGDPLPDDRPALPSVEEIERCMEDPDSDLTVQPDAAEEAENEVKGAVEPALEHELQPALIGPIDSDDGRTGEAVKRLNAEQDEVASPDIAREVFRL